MLGFSLPKLIVLALIVWGVWYGFKLVARRNRLRTREAAREAEAEPRPAIEDMTKCPACGTFVPAADTRDCGRKGCPFPV